MFGSYSYGYNSPRTFQRKGPPPMKSSKWRVVSQRPLPVATDKEEHSEILCDLPPNTKCDVLHTDIVSLPNGTQRVCIIDPVWKGWVTIRTASGQSNLELVDGDDDAAEAVRRIGGTHVAGRITGGATVDVADGAAVEAPILLTLAQILSLQSDCMADDVAVEEDEMRRWSEAELTAYFESGGSSSCRPPRRAPLVAASSANGASDGGVASSEGAASGDGGATKGEGDGEGDAGGASKGSGGASDTEVPKMTAKQIAARVLLLVAPAS